jgi:hypothetical protein
MAVADLYTTLEGIYPGSDVDQFVSDDRAVRQARLAVSMARAGHLLRLGENEVPIEEYRELVLDFYE